MILASYRTASPNPPHGRCCFSASLASASWPIVASQRQHRWPPDQPTVRSTAEPPFGAAFCYARRLPGLADRVAKVPKCAATNFPPRTKQATIADRCALNRVTEIACEFIASRRSPSHDYLIVAPTARRNHVQ